MACLYDEYGGQMTSSNIFQAMFECSQQIDCQMIFKRNHPPWRGPGAKFYKCHPFRYPIKSSDETATYIKGYFE